MIRKILNDYKINLIEKQANFIIEQLSNEISILKWLEFTNIYFSNRLNYKEIDGLQEKLVAHLLEARVVTSDDEEIEVLDTISKELEYSLVKQDGLKLVV